MRGICGNQVRDAVVDVILICLADEVARVDIEHPPANLESQCMWLRACEDTVPRYARDAPQDSLDHVLGTAN